MRVKEKSEKVGLKFSIWKTKIIVSGPISSLQIEGENVETVVDFIFLGSKITVDGDCDHKIKRPLLLGRKAMMNLDSNIKKQRHHYADKSMHSQSYGFFGSHVQMWELDHKEGWVTKNSCFQIVVLEKTLESLVDSRKSKHFNPKVNQPWIVTGRTDAEASILWPPEQGTDSLGKTLMLGKIEGRRRRRQQRMK